MSRCDQRDRVWKRRGERYTACNIMVCGGISLEGHTALLVLARATLTAIRYQDEILRPILSSNVVAVALGSF